MRFGVKTVFDGAVAVEAIRAEAQRQIQGLEKALAGKGIGVAFARMAKPDPVGDMGLLSGLIVHLILGSPFVASFGLHGLDSTFDHALASAVMECATAFSEDEEKKRKASRCDDYPEGRRKCPLEQARIRPKFRLASETKETHLARSTKAELAFLHEMLDLLERVERLGAKKIHVNGNAYDSLQRLAA